MNTKALEFHKEAELFPPMSDPELDALVEDIRHCGQPDLIFLNEVKILVGQLRLLVCQL